MAGSGTYQVNAGRFQDPMNSFNNSTRMLQDSISAIGERKTARQDEALKALQQQKVLINEKNKKDILLNTNRDQYDQLLADEQSAAIGLQATNDYNKLYDIENMIDDGTGTGAQIAAKRTSSDPAAQAILTDRQNRWEDGYMGVAQGETASPAIQEMTENLGMKPDSAKAYSDRIYNEMLKAGVPTDQAEAQRKQVLAKTQGAEPRKGALALLKTQSDNINNQAKAQADIAMKNGLVNKATTNRFGIKGNSNKSSSNKSGYKNIPDSGIDPGTSILGRIFGGVGADVGNSVADKLYNDDFGKSQIEEMMSNNTVKEWWGSQNEYDARTGDELYTNLLKYAKENNITPSGKKTSGNEGSSETIYDKHYVAGTMDLVDKIYAQAKTDVNKAYKDAGVTKGEPQPLLTQKMISNVVSSGQPLPSVKKENKVLGDKSFSDKTVIGSAMNDKKSGLLAGQVLADPKTFTKEYNELSAPLQKKVDRVLSNDKSKKVFDTYNKKMVLEDTKKNEPVVVPDTSPSSKYTPGMKVADFDGSTIEFYESKKAYEKENPEPGMFMSAREDILNFARGNNSNNYEPGAGILSDIGTTLANGNNAVKPNPRVVNTAQDAPVQNFNQNVLPELDQNNADRKVLGIGPVGRNTFDTEGFQPTNDQILQDQNQKVMSKNTRQSRYSDKSKEMFNGIYDAKQRMSPSEQREFSRVRNDPSISVVDKIAMFIELGLSMSEAQQALQ